MALKYSIMRGKTVELDHDPDNWEVYTLPYRPEVWTASKAVIENELIVIPTVPNGCMYVVSQGGITGGTEPTTWNTEKNSVTSSGTAKFKALPYTLALRTGDAITDFEILPIDGLTIDNDSLINDSVIRFRITAVPAATQVTLTIRVTVLLASGITVKYDDSIILNILER